MNPTSNLSNPHDLLSFTYSRGWQNSITYQTPTISACVPLPGLYTSLSDHSIPATQKDVLTHPA